MVQGKKESVFQVRWLEIRADSTLFFVKERFHFHTCLEDGGWRQKVDK